MACMVLSLDLALVEHQWRLVAIGTREWRIESLFSEVPYFLKMLIKQLMCQWMVPWPGYDHQAVDQGTDNQLQAGLSLQKVYLFEMGIVILLFDRHQWDVHFVKMCHGERLVSDLHVDSEAVKKILLDFP